ncbi:hypothetical protein L6452_39681 [Arctium lappa]|uniref:Uncharacterized protein n=1 Tax=Arctium lappa TaxID=4217 RepID=A0ACB8XSZ3_ARCLA|nr:hypothetical protein L6452_39681 [Arctium lappa]
MMQWARVGLMGLLWALGRCNSRLGTWVRPSMEAGIVYGSWNQLNNSETISPTTFTSSTPSLLRLQADGGEQWARQRHRDESNDGGLFDLNKKPNNLVKLISSNLF